MSAEACGGLYPVGRKEGTKESGSGKLGADAKRGMANLATVSDLAEGG